MTPCHECAHCAKVASGITEYDGHLIDKFRYECRRLPPQRGVLGTAFPRAIARCGEFAPSPQSDPT